MKKPENPRNYIIWWNDNFKEDMIGLEARKLYGYVSAFVKYDFDHSDAFMTLIHELRNYDAEYRQSYGYDLLMKKPEELELESKEWDKFISKIWRKNVVQNTKWNDENWDKEVCQPNEGWITPSNWFERIHDIVRTRIIVKYFDGVGLLVDRMCSHFEGCGCLIDPDWEAREEGYYAAHLNVTRDYEIPVGLETQRKKISVEIQVTTQMKDVITELTHKYYERRRETLEQPDIKWQWDYNSEEFLPNYIGHILHYIEGEVMQIRNREQLHGKRE
jgi:ppGpp synthetase/RelA/SpoT-type nucleotidyltranferase